MCSRTSGISLSNLRFVVGYRSRSLSGPWWWRRRAGGRPPLDQKIVDIILTLKKENPLWGARRIREELRNGVSPRAAITAGCDRAFSAIADSNVTALIAGLVLLFLGAGAVRGFATVLVFGIATSMFTALMGTRALVQIIYGGKRKVDRLSI